MLNPIVFCSGFLLLMSALYLYPGNDNVISDAYPPSSPYLLLQNGDPLSRQDLGLEAGIAVGSRTATTSNSHAGGVIDPEDGWQLIYTGNPQEVLKGSVEDLLGALRRSGHLAVEVSTFHGRLTVECADAYETEDGNVGCDFDFWCKGPARDTIPAHHKHVGIVRSDGEMQQVVATMNERQEEKIEQVVYVADTLSWYVR